MSSATDRQWIRWGKQNPYYGILGMETAEFESHWEEPFFRSGAEHMDRVFACLERVDAQPRKFEKALDFGCGAGRLLRPLEGRFQELVGVDVSEDQLNLARRNVTSAGAAFVRSLGDLDDQKGAFDFVNTFVVLQHIRPRFGLGIIGQLIDLLGPGGAFALHMTVGDTRPSRRRLNWLRYRIPPLHWAYNIRTGRPWNEPVTEMNRYDMAAVSKILLDRGISRFSIELFDHNGHMGMLLLGRKD